MRVRVLSAICVLLATATETVPTPTGTSAPPTGTSAPIPSSMIPLGYTYYPATGSFYKFHNIRVTCLEANTTCAMEGAHLVVLNNAEEADIVAGIVTDAVGDYNTWTGLRDNRPGGVMEWSTVHGEPLSDVFHEWAVGRPNNEMRWSCAVLYAYNKLLYDVPCGLMYYSTCEISQ